VRFSRQGVIIAAKAVADSLARTFRRRAGFRVVAVLARLLCLTAHRDEATELAYAALCADGPVMCLAGLSLVPGHQGGHGALRDESRRLGIARLHRTLAGLPLLRAAEAGRVDLR
jgi:hypothetical protein